MQPIKCLIVDDEPNAIRILEEYLKSFPQFVVEATAGNAFEALTILHQGRTDLLFLDIQMPMITGMQLLQSLANRPYVIITTAHRDFAADAFDFEVTDYLLKPISFERFAKSVNRLLSTIEKSSVPTSVPDSLQAQLSIRSNRKELRIPFNEILYFKAMGDYVVLFLTTGEKHITLDTLTAMSEKLPSNEFARIHRSFIVNRRHIRAIGLNTIEIGKVILPLSQSYRPLI